MCKGLELRDVVGGERKEALEIEGGREAEKMEEARSGISGSEEGASKKGWFGWGMFLETWISIDFLRRESSEDR